MQLKTENMQIAAMTKKKKKKKSEVQNSYFIQKRNTTGGTSHCESLKKKYSIPSPNLLVYKTVAIANNHFL
jgi:hypothetical protein